MLIVVGSQTVVALVRLSGIKCAAVQILIVCLVSLLLADNAAASPGVAEAKGFSFRA